MVQLAACRSWASGRCLKLRQTLEHPPVTASSADSTFRWLLEGDPAIRWQVLRDLVGAPEDTVERERRKVAREGWGERLLAKQDPAGTWAGGKSSDDGLYHPKCAST